MKNGKTIVLSGFAYGGTNILWNILQSHPDIVAPPYETGQIFKTSLILRLLYGGQLWKYTPFTSQIIDHILHYYKMKSLQHLDNRFISEKTLYSRHKMSKSALCLKSVNADIFITDLLISVYPNLFFIGLTRNGYSLLDGYVRRGWTATETGKLYHRIAEQMKKYVTSANNSKLVKFEEIMQKPFDVANDLYKFLDVYPYELESLRLKSKKIIDSDGKHNIIFGSEGRKYWFSKENIHQIIKPDIDQKQKYRLSRKMLDEFSREAETALQYFGYEIL